MGIFNIFDEIEQKYRLGITGEAQRLSGGLTHEMYRIETMSGYICIKLLNPHIMARNDAAENYRIAEKLEYKLECKKIPIIPAKIIGGRKMLEVRGQFFYVFDYFDGKKLDDEEITPYHAEKIGEILAKIHGIEEKISSVPRRKIKIEFKNYLTPLEKSAPEVHSLLMENLTLLNGLAEKNNSSIGKIPPRLTICHRDMDTKNVLWCGGDMRIIDLECLSYDSPSLEMFETAMAWSGLESGHFDSARLRAFLNGYKKAVGKIGVPGEILYDCSVGRLEWLEYSLQRVLGIGSGENERETGISEAIKTIGYLKYYSQMREKILECFKT